MKLNYHKDTDSLYIDLSSSPARTAVKSQRELFWIKMRTAMSRGST